MPANAATLKAMQFSVLWDKKPMNTTGAPRARALLKATDFVPPHRPYIASPSICVKVRNSRYKRRCLDWIVCCTPRPRG